MKEIVFAGFGGQGVLTAGVIISQIALYKGFNATWMPAYGAAMRGGTANCTVKYGEEMVYNPGQQKPDLLLAMNMPSFNKFVKIVRPGGIVLVNEDMITGDTDVRDDITIVKIPCNKIADSMKNPKGASIVMIGAIVKLMGDFSFEEGMNGMNEMFAKKGKSKFQDINSASYTAGYKEIEDR